MADQTAQTEEFIFQNVAYRPTVYRTGVIVYNFFTLVRHGHLGAIGPSNHQSYLQFLLSEVERHLVLRVWTQRIVANHCRHESKWARISKSDPKNEQLQNQACDLKNQTVIIRNNNNFWHFSHFWGFSKLFQYWLQFRAPNQQFEFSECFLLFLDMILKKRAVLFLKLAQ